MSAPKKGTPAYTVWVETRRYNAEKLERAFWYDVALPLSLAGYPLPRTQYVFHPTRRWKLDAAYIAQRVGVEIDGGLWLGAAGGHTSASASERDREKGNELAAAGWLLVRLTKRMLEDGRALVYVERALRAAHTAGAA